MPTRAAASPQDPRLQWDYRLVPADIAEDEERRDRWLADLASENWWVEAGPLLGWDGTPYLLWRRLAPATRQDQRRTRPAT